MIILGLTGSIGMGKSTTARMFADAGVPIHDSDETVHRLYSGAAAPLVEYAFPGTATAGTVIRSELAKRVLDHPDALKRLEAIVHPLVRADADAFVERQRAAGAELVVLDIPLLFETGARHRVDKVAVTTADPDIQRQRVLARPGMSEEKFQAIIAKQVPDAEKRRQADYIIDTGHDMESARREVGRIIAELSGKKPK